jgi:DNA primase
MTSNLDQVLERVNILDVVSQYVKLRKAGRNFVGLCPFHQEKTPSFTVSVEKQIYYCFGCHEGGNAVNFLAKYDRVTFFEALEGLAAQVGVEVSRRGGASRKPIFDALTRLADYFQENLKRSAPALKYLSDRNIDSQTITSFRLGYSERKSYGKDFARRLGAPLDILLSAGIMKMRDGGEMYDIFRGRIVIPIFDINGKVIGFGGRSMERDAIPKYINSPESSVFSKRSVLYGMDRAKREITAQDHAVIVEGYFDLMSLHKAGIGNVVATLGTAITEEQVSRLRNFTENITLVLDGDEAGIKSAFRLITLFGEMDINGNMVILPDGHDPDSLVRGKSGEAFSELLKDRRPLLDCLFDVNAKQFGVKTLEGRLAFVRSILPYVEDMKDSVRRRLYVRKLADLTGVEESLFWDRLGNKGTERADVAAKESETIIDKMVVGIALNKPELIEVLIGKGVESRVKDVHLRELLSRLFEYYRKNGSLDLKLFLNVLEEPELRERAVSTAMDVAECDEQEMERIVADYLSYADSVLIREEARGITQRLAEAERNGDENALRELLEQKRQMVATMKYKSAK